MNGRFSVLPAVGLALGVSHFGWSSAFILSFVLDWETPRAEEVPVW